MKAKHIKHTSGCLTGRRLSDAGLSTALKAACRRKSAAASLRTDTDGEFRPRPFPPASGNIRSERIALHHVEKGGE
jgi:hypothetical protein